MYINLVKLIYLVMVIGLLAYSLKFVFSRKIEEKIIGVAGCILGVYLLIVSA